MKGAKYTLTSTYLLKQLESRNAADVTKALNKLEKTANVNDLPSIIKLMSGLTEKELLNAFTDFLSKVKSKAAPAIMADALSEPNYAGIRPELTRACWESGLDYTPYLLLFARIFIAGDYLLALEAFTMIENTCLERPVARKILDEISILIKNSLPDQPETKQRLTRELILILEPFITED
ncbi:MAG: hypothetical protein WC699_00740 [Bacteroidales bacterium]|jgi:hypothetical protein